MKIDIVELPGKKGKTRTVYRVDLLPASVNKAIGDALHSCIHLKKMHTYDYENGYVEFMSDSDAELYVEFK